MMIFSTKEWSEKSFNICLGCSHMCAYCYAREMVLRFGRIQSPEEWATEQVNRGKIKTMRKWVGVTMFSTTHDVTPGIFKDCLITLRKLLEIGNNVLLVSKPHYNVVNDITLDGVVAVSRDRIEFRFPITSLNEGLSAVWEPGAPKPVGRIQALELARSWGFKTSVSMEPALSMPAVAGEFRELSSFAEVI